MATGDIYVWQEQASGKLQPIKINGASSGQISLNPITGLLTADTGWTANSDAGSKTAIIPASATLSAMQAALNLVVAGFGDAFVATAAKAKALEDAAAAFKVPNA